MVYRDSDFSERIYLCSAGESASIHYIEITRYGSIFVVETCCTPGWSYTFRTNDLSDYERVKFNIMDAIFESESLDELLDSLSDTFTDGFANILIEDGDDDE